MGSWRQLTLSPDLNGPAQGLIFPGLLWADQIPAAGDRLLQREQAELLWGLGELALLGAAGAGEGGGGLHRRKEKKRPHSRPLSRRVKAASRALALALTLRRCQPIRLLARGRTIGEVPSPAVHHR